LICAAGLLPRRHPLRLERHYCTGRRQRSTNYEAPRHSAFSCASNSSNGARDHFALDLIDVGEVGCVEGGPDAVLVDVHGALDAGLGDAEIWRY
jgi:hypothetical protein